MKYILFISIALLFQACNTAPKTQITPNIKTHKTNKNTTLSHKNGLLEGTILSIEKINTFYKYTIKLIDSKKIISFLYNKRLYNENDIVYVDLNKNTNEATSMYLSKQNFNEINLNYIKKPTHKRTKSRQTPFIGLPKTQDIELF